MNHLKWNRKIQILNGSQNAICRLGVRFFLDLIHQEYDVASVVRHC